jgi:hypothetical protein
LRVWDFGGGEGTMDALYSKSILQCDVSFPLCSSLSSFRIVCGPGGDVTQIPGCFGKFR